MYRPPSALIGRPTWRAIVVSYALVATIPVSLLFLSQPVVLAVTGAAIAGLFVAGRRFYRLVQCYSDCESITWNPAGRAQVTVTQRSGGRGENHEQSCC